VGRWQPNQGGSTTTVYTAAAPTETGKVGSQPWWVSGCGFASFNASDPTGNTTSPQADWAATQKLIFKQPAPSAVYPPPPTHLDVASQAAVAALMLDPSAACAGHRKHQNTCGSTYMADQV